MLESATMGGLRGVEAHMSPNQRAARLRLFSPGGHLAKELAHNATGDGCTPAAPLPKPACVFTLVYRCMSDAQSPTSVLSYDNQFDICTPHSVIHVSCSPVRIACRAYDMRGRGGVPLVHS